MAFNTCWPVMGLLESRALFITLLTSFISWFLSAVLRANCCECSRSMLSELLSVCRLWLSGCCWGSARFNSAVTACICAGCNLSMFVGVLDSEREVAAFKSLGCCCADVTELGFVCVSLAAIRLLSLGSKFSVPSARLVSKTASPLLSGMLVMSSMS